MTVGGNGLRESDVAMFATLRIPLDLVENAGVIRVTDAEAREYGLNGAADLAGLLFPYCDPLTGVRHTCRLRRDHPDVEDGKPHRKYLAPYGDRRHLYFIAGIAKAAIEDKSIPVILVEAEKSCLALTAWAQRMARKTLVIAMGGCWGWRGRIGKIDGPHGERLDEKGALPELQVCAGREVTIMLDANASSNVKVRRARAALAKELLAMGCRVRIASVPTMDGVNGPDDLVAAVGDDLLRSLLDDAAPAAEIAIADAEAAIAEIKESRNLDAEVLRTAIDAVANVPDPLERKMLEVALAAATRGKITKAAIVEEIRNQREHQLQTEIDIKQQAETAELLRRPVDPAQLVDDLEKYFTDRAYLPEGAGLILAYFTLNTYTFDVFDTVPYISVESAVPGCGKSTVLCLLESVCYRPRRSTSPSEAVLFRTIDSESPTLLIDEAETLEGHSERAMNLKAILHEGYKVGGKVGRCNGEEHEVKYFNCYCPKATAAIGGHSGPLLDRCIITHMEKAPRNYLRKSTRVRALKREAKALLEHLKAYALQKRGELAALYEAEPDCGYWPDITDREAELYGPLLTHARLIGSDAEQKLLAVVEKFTASKADIQTADWPVAKAIAILEVLEKLVGDTFTPGDLVDGLA